MTVDSRLDEDEIRIIRYRSLAREVCDPLAVCLLRLIVVEELEADFLEARGSGLSSSAQSRGLI
jgi:hypothetical protein